MKFIKENQSKTIEFNLFGYIHRIGFYTKKYYTKNIRKTKRLHWNGIWQISFFRIAYGNIKK